MMDADPSTHDGDHELSLPVLERPLWLSEHDTPSKTGDAFLFRTSAMMDSLLSASTSTNTSATPPASSSTRLFHDKDTDFVPPARPSSTPFPFLDKHSHSQACCGDDVESAFIASSSDENMTDTSTESTPSVANFVTHFDELPIEVHEAILDHLFGYCVSATSRSGMGVTSLTRTWNTVLRHSRRREMTNLALVNRLWRVLVQQRLYRHIKLKGTLRSIEDALAHFAIHQRLACYVKHVEVWFPVFHSRHSYLRESSYWTTSPGSKTDADSFLPEVNCSLENVFRFAAMVLSEIRVLTLEGGERRKAPPVPHFDSQDASVDARLSLLRLFSVRTLVTKGQWNLMRQHRDFTNILGALPNLVEWHGSYSKPKSKSYLSMSAFLPFLPPYIRSINLCLENDYRREALQPTFFSKVAEQTHICAILGRTMLKLEEFAYTGRVCHHVFESAVRSLGKNSSKLRSIDITVKNCCRRTNVVHDSGSGIQDMGFIAAFEKLVLAGIRSLQQLQRIHYLRIRFVDLDSILPPLNPYFLMQGGICSGVWSDTIVSEMARVRPDATFSELNESFGNISYTKEGRIIITPESPRTRITSLKLSNYQTFANRITIH